MIIIPATGDLNLMKRIAAMTNIDEEKTFYTL